MGCYAAFNAIKLADRICDSDPKANVLILSVELCTIHFQKIYTEDNLIANAIFGDGAAAVLISKNGRGLKIKNYGSQIVKEGANDMAWSIGDFGFEMSFSNGFCIALCCPFFNGKPVRSSVQHTMYIIWIVICPFA